MFSSSLIFMGTFLWGLNSTIADKIISPIRLNSDEQSTSTQNILDIFNNTRNMSVSTLMDSFLPNSPTSEEDRITILSSDPSDRTLDTPNTTSMERSHKSNLSGELNITEKTVFNYSTSKYSQLTLKGTHPSLPNDYQITPLSSNNKTNVPKETLDNSDLSWRTNSRQTLETSFTTAISENGEKIPTTGNLHEITPATKVNLSSLCVVSLISKEGVITNRGYPYAYGDAEHCQWIVRLPHGPRIKVTFEDLDLEFDKDFLEISFGEEDEYYSRRYTGSKVPPATVLDTDQIRIVFKTDRDGHGRGFYIYFEETNEAPSFPLVANPLCSKLSISKGGNLVTPGYPQTDYSNNQFCSWVIAGPANSVIKLQIEDFHTEIYDQLTIGVGLDARSNASSALIRLFGLVDTPQETIIPANALWLQFRSDESVTASGININYQIIERHICKSGEDFTSRHGVLQSENYPQEYPINSECRWTIRGEKGSHIILHFLHFHLQDGHDFLLVGEGPDVFVGNFTQFTGRIEHNQILRMKINNVWLHFTSDHVRGDRFYSGFKIAYSVDTVDSPPSNSNIQGHVSRNSIHKHLPSGSKTTLDAMTNGRALNKSKNNNFMVYIQGYSKTEMEKKRESLLDTLVNLFVRFCQKKVHENCLIKNENIQLLSVVEENSENKVRIYFNIKNKMTTSESEDFQQFLVGTNIRLHSSQLSKKTLTSSEDFVEKSALPSWLVAVIATVIFLVVVFFAMLFYSLLRSKKTSRSSKGSCQVSSSSSDQPNAAELEEDNGEIKITSFVGTQDKEHTSTPVSDDQKESKLSYRPEISLTSNRENENTTVSIQPASIDQANEKEASSLDHKITLQPSPKKKETDLKALIPSRKQNDPVPIENAGLCLEEVSTDL